MKAFKPFNPFKESARLKSLYSILSFGGLYPSVLIQGVVGNTYLIQDTTNLADTNAWVTIANLTLAQTNQLFVDTNTDASLPANPLRFYRVLPGQ